jgi:hypothetical protein
MSNEKDFPVSNIICSNCGQMCYFSQKQSTDMVAIFYCNNDVCPLDHFFVRAEETEWSHCIVERME